MFCVFSTNLTLGIRIKDLHNSKSVAMRIGTRFNAICAPFILSGAELKFVHEVKSVSYTHLTLPTNREV